MLLPTVVMPRLAQGCGIEETGACAWLAVGGHGITAEAAVLPSDIGAVLLALL